MVPKTKSKKELFNEIVGLHQQISELEALIRKGISTKKALQNPVELTKAMLEYVNDAIYVYQDLSMKFVNKKAVKITGFTPEELMSRPQFDLIHPDDRPVITERFLRRVRGEEVPDLYPHRLIDKWGNVKWIEVTSVLITWEGRPAQLSFMKDITEKKAAEDALRQSEQLRADIINFLPDATFAIDYQGRIIAWNRAIENLTGIASHEVIGKADYEYALAFYGERKPILIDKALHPSIPVEERYLSFISDKDFLLAETELIYQGRNITLWCKAALMKDAKGKVVGAIESLRDITALKETNTALRVLLKQRENDRKEIEEKFLLNIKELVLPYVLKLREARLEMPHAVNVAIIENHLNTLMSPFMSKLTEKYIRLSPREKQVASLIKDGLTTKDIANVLNISINSIDIYRQNIRKKAELNRKKINLRSFLTSLNND
ncbi:MAG: PAS domain S-box protein [Deltaproteobacteria bacterium]|nr:PAS domain S-box protein [Deltaproteobacteria bacterium]